MVTTAASPHPVALLGSPPATPPTCPRCGYDLSGAAASWAAACPMSLVCSECGLDIDCREVFNPVYAIQRTLFEHAKVRRLRALVGTALKACRPRRFWSWVRMAHAIRPRRMILGAALGTLLVYLASVVVGTALAAGAGYVEMLIEGVSRTKWMRPSQGFSAALLAEFALHIAWPIGSLDKNAMYTLWWPPEDWLVYPAARIGLLAALLMPLSFLLLPATLRHARVRHAHLVRIWAYSWIGLIPCLAGLGAADLLFQQYIWWSGEAWTLYETWGRFGHTARLLVILLWLLAWWSAACGRYLRLRTPLAVAAAMLCISALLATVTVLAWLGPHLVDDLGIR